MTLTLNSPVHWASSLRQYFLSVSLLSNLQLQMCWVLDKKGTLNYFHDCAVEEGVGPPWAEGLALSK